MKLNSLKPITKKGLILTAFVQIILLIWAQQDITKRPKSKIKGKKWLWRIIACIDIFGPVAYFKYGRKH